MKLQLLMLLAPVLAGAQVRGPAQRDSTPRLFDPEVRADAILARRSAGQLGLGLTYVAGIYVRAGIVAAGGYGNDGASGRVDGFGRFHFDPFRQSRWAPYGGGGLSARFDHGSPPHGYLLLLLGLDGPIHNGATSSIELGLGGGVRLGVILRQAAVERR